MLKKIFIVALAILVMGGANVALAENSMGGSEKTHTKTEKTIDLPCVQSAVAVRESAIQKAFTAYSGSVSTALTARATALNTAWGMTVGTERRAARKSAWEAYRTSVQSARTTMKTAKKSAWEAFKTASKACKVEVVESEESDMI